MSPAAGNVLVIRSGPVFERDAEIMGRFVHDAIQAVMEEGEQELDKLLQPRPEGVYLSADEAQPGHASKGHYREHVHGEIHGPTGTITDGSVVYGPWLEGVSRRNETTRFKGYASFRRTYQKLEKNVDKILEPVVRHAVDEFNGV